MDFETQVRRFEQQLGAFEKLHASELKELADRLAAYMQIHADEVKLLREQLADLKKAAGMQADPHGRSDHPGTSGER